MGKRIADATSAEVEASFGERLARLRKAAGFTQIELAAHAGLQRESAGRAAGELSAANRQLSQGRFR